MFSSAFYAATKECSTMQSLVPAPYLRRRFAVRSELESAVLIVCGLGFYRLYVNGNERTKGLLAPYISNPDQLVFYDTYDITSSLRVGENMLGFWLGNGMQNAVGGLIWGFDKAEWHGAPKVAFALELTFSDGTREVLEADEKLLCTASPLYFDDLRIGEWYDATKELPLWSSPTDGDEGWSPAIPAQTPRGECRLCDCEPIVKTQELKAKRIYRGKIGRQPQLRDGIPLMQAEGVEGQTSGWIYDFGINAAGICRLHVHAKAGQKIVMQFCEEVMPDGSGDLDLSGMTFLPQPFNHRNIYICKDGEQEWKPGFAYHGFRYCLVMGITEEQATEDLLTYEVMNSDIDRIGGFSCSDETVNRITAACATSVLSNFYYFPTDCPQREKNGWTADAALSAEHTVTFFQPDRSYRQWLRCVCAAQTPEGALPGVVPTDRFGFEWGNGPAWDCVLFYLPFVLYQYRGDTSAIIDCADAMALYLRYLSEKRREDGLLSFGLGDWCQVGRPVDQPQSPLAFTDSVIAMDICAKAVIMFDAVGMDLQAQFARNLHNEIRVAVRRELIDPNTLLASGNCQTSQAMGLYYGVFEPQEEEVAFERLMEMVRARADKLDVGVLGGRVLFHVLSAFGQTSLAYRMIVGPEFPSYGYWIHTMGATTLFEDFLPLGDTVNSHNHHFWGDVTSWFVRELAGLKVNPYMRDANEIEVSPHLISELSHAEAFHKLPCGQVSVSWRRNGDEAVLEITLPEGAHGRLIIDPDWQTQDGQTVLSLASGTVQLVRKSR